MARLTRPPGRVPRFVVVALWVGLIGGLGGCGTGTAAPTVVTPSRDVVTSAPPVTALPSTSQTGGGSCGSSLEFGPTPVPSTRSHRFGATAQTTDADDDSVRLAVVVQAPKVVSQVTEDAPDDGKQYVAIAISVTLTGGSSDYVGSIDSFSVLDPQGNRCDYREDTGAIPAAQEWQGIELTTTKKSAKGSMVFEVPITQDLTKLTVAFVSGLGDTATDRWTA
ncbi:hypothetical protein [Allobranchiibius sp. CTAmp26]|uniref:hypothetical protein n=1 Tax=Allobranchiibius sp. CTAmp26 TaxID=2815214 RepID=UPI001AA119D4|nr:hypothetical protein [Allobranchiibius sp. CTAmp26]MBO1755227.1 hypothetical protein [Allobranchiibius sp. CTAmp26]